ncbi:armadillo repeat-containing protein 7-like isoform X2 [Rhopilema esculentum]|uniref:armadillo repeat-containing protein 7-like isoform X2 n=1 Tax=Rhopilema esculentum TaxID=499914 RepID=UPI0031D16872
MFSTEEYVERKSAASGRGRFDYLQALVTEFQDTDSQGAKVQILANLANFSYDPINYGHLRKLNVVDLFLDMISEDDADLVKFGIGGICNLCLDKENKQIIAENDGVELIIKCLSSPDEETVINAITALIYLSSHSNKSASEDVIECMTKFQSSSNIRLRNLAVIYLQDCCGLKEK